MTARNNEDENMLSEIGKMSPNQQGAVKLMIYDARSYLNALANKVL